MCNKAVDTCLSVLKLIPDCLVLIKMLEILKDVEFSDNDIDLDYRH